MFRRVLVSVSDKSGLLEFLKPIEKNGAEIVSTGGTAQFLREAGVKVREVSDVTGFPEMMDGRVRTLHPKIHMGLLARSHVPEDSKILKEYGVEPFDLVVVNLYPFEAAYKKGLRGQELVEQIDIGGPSLLRAAAKSFERLTVVCDAADYPRVASAVASGKNDQPFRKSLASKVFGHCSFYDSLVEEALSDENILDAKTKTLALRKKAELRYGENPHQKAAWYENAVPAFLSLSQAQVIQGKELSFNNIVDLEAAVGAVADFDEPCAVIVKHATPCGVALGDSIHHAYKRAFEADSVSAFGGIVALNKPVSSELATELIGPFLECVIAPEFSDDAKKILAAKKNLRILELKDLTQSAKLGQQLVPQTLEFKSLRGGALIQTADQALQWSSDFKITLPPGVSAIDAELKRELLFAQRVVRHVKSNGIVVTKKSQTLGICGGQTNRVDSVKWALERAQGKASDVILGSDAFFPFRDSIDLAAARGVKWVIQPGGSLRDQEVEAAVKEHQMGMIVTGLRHFKH